MPLLLAPRAWMVPPLTSTLAAGLPPCRYTPLASVPLTVMAPLFWTRLPGPLMAMPCALAPWVRMLPLLSTSVPVLPTLGTEMPRTPLPDVVIDPRLINWLLSPKPTMAPREAPAPPAIWIVPSLTIRLRSSTDSARVALVENSAPGATVMVTFWLPAAASTDWLTTAPSHCTLCPLAGASVGAQAAAAGVAPKDCSRPAAASMAGNGASRAGVRRRALRIGAPVRNILHSLCESSGWIRERCVQFVKIIQ
ncbi:Uncharacterised protein [Bordetella pertussis]|nr:Uncharacterised protein [Bordetella pertussis]